jgi:hypothetical protein
LLDGSGDRDLNRALIGALMTHEEVRVERKAHVTGTIGKRYSRQSITGCDKDGNPIPSRTEDARRLREEIGMIAKRTPGALLVTTKGAEDALLAGEHLGEDIATAHAGALRGKNAWENRSTVIAVGQESLSIDQVELIARGFMATDPLPFVSMADPELPADWPWKQWPYRATRMRRMQDGTLQPIEVDVHPDLRVQRVLEQIREAEVIQGIDRVRPVFNRRNIIAMNQLVLDLTYDRIAPHRDLIRGGDRIECALARAGVLPGTPADLLRAFPDLFCSEITARRELRVWQEKWGQNPNRESIWNLTPFIFRRPGQRGKPSTVWVSAHHATPQAAAEAVLGPLAQFQPVAAGAAEALRLELELPKGVSSVADQWPDRCMPEDRMAWLPPPMLKNADPFRSRAPPDG